MTESKVETVGDFRRFVEKLVTAKASSYQGSLEDYLRSLWKLIQQRRNEPVSYRLLSSLLDEAFSAAPAPFDEDWLIYTKPPLMLDPDQVQDDFAQVRDLILYQIADLHQLKSNGTLDQPGHILWLGVKSPHSNHFWYNFHVASYLASAVQGLSADSDNAQCSWADLAVILWIGQIYE